MNGIANGRIQKSVAMAQRSPSHMTFADAIGRRRVSSVNPALANALHSSVHPEMPTPLSPELQRAYAELQTPGTAMAHLRISDNDSDNPFLPANSFSPPTTPLYAAQFARTRFGAGAFDTPPQSAPPGQQCFSGLNAMAQANGFGMMANEYPLMPSVFPNPQSFMDVPQMSYMMSPSGELMMGYPVVPPFAQQQQPQSTPPNQQHPFVPSSASASTSPRVVAPNKQTTPAPSVDFFVHEYSPPQEFKPTAAAAGTVTAGAGSATPRKTVDLGPRNYTFSNHGPEFFEKNIKKEFASSPVSSSSIAADESVA